MDSDEDLICIHEWVHIPSPASPHKYLCLHCKEWHELLVNPT